MTDIRITKVIAACKMLIKRRQKIYIKKHDNKVVPLNEHQLGYTLKYDINISMTFQILNFE